MWWNTIFVTCSCQWRRVLAYHVSAQMQIRPHRSFLCVSGVHSHPKPEFRLVLNTDNTVCLQSAFYLKYVWNIRMPELSTMSACTLNLRWGFFTCLSACTWFHQLSEFLLRLLFFLFFSFFTVFTSRFAVKVSSVVSNTFLFFTLFVLLFVHGTNPSLCACVRVLLLTPYWTLPMQL